MLGCNSYRTIDLYAIDQINPHVSAPDVNKSGNNLKFFRTYFMLTFYTDSLYSDFDYLRIDKRLAKSHNKILSVTDVLFLN